MTEYFIVRLGNGWYSFNALPQWERHLRMSSFRCGSDFKAMEIGRLILGNAGGLLSIIGQPVLKTAKKGSET